MKTLGVIILMLSFFTASQAQEITFNALVNGVIDDAEIKKELILNGFTKITGSSDSSTDTYAFGYNEEEETAAIWVIITTHEAKATSEKTYNLYTIDIQSFVPFIHDDLKEEIIQNCTFEGIEDNDALVYKFKSKTVFNISSEDGTNIISLYPLFDPDSPDFETEVVEWQRQEQERIERERQEEAERLNSMGRDAFGNQGVGSRDADRYDTGGGLGDGISFGGLGSRRAIGNLPKPNLSGCEITQKIEVRVDIQVDRDGNVVSATVSSATFQDKCIWDIVVEAAKKSRFSADRSANNRQSGWIKYIIVP